MCARLSLSWSQRPMATTCFCCPHTVPNLMQLRWLGVWPKIMWPATIPPEPVSVTYATLSWLALNMWHIKHGENWMKKTIKEETTQLAALEREEARARLAQFHRELEIHRTTSWPCLLPTHSLLYDHCYVTIATSPDPLWQSNSQTFSETIQSNSQTPRQSLFVVVDKRFLLLCIYQQYQPTPLIHCIYLEVGAGLNATITDHHIRLTPNILLGYSMTKNSLIDQIYLLTVMILKPQELKTGSDHELVYVTRKKESLPVKRSSFIGRLYKNYDKIYFQQMISNHDWTDFTSADSPDLAWSIMKETIEGVIDRMCPLKLIKI